MAIYVYIQDSSIGTDNINKINIINLLDERYRLDKDKEDAIYNWARASLGYNVVVIWDKPNAQRPALPYLTLCISGGPIQIGDRPVKKYKELDTWTYQFKYRITLSINLFGYSNYLFLMNQLLSSLHLETKIQILNNAGLAYWGVDGPIDLSSFRDTEWEYRSQADIFLSYGEDIDDKPGEIHKVEINGNVIDIT